MGFSGSLLAVTWDCDFSLFFLFNFAKKSRQSEFFNRYIFFISHGNLSSPLKYE